MTICYEIGAKLYLNITNRCNCACTFCIRTTQDNAYGSDPLWLEHEPTLDEIKAALSDRTLSAYQEIVFCGFGEPTKRLDVLLEVADFLRQHGAKRIRLNTNGLADLEYGESIAPRLAGNLDAVSISLNAGTKETYLAVTRPVFGESAWEGMQRFAQNCKQFVLEVQMTIVDVLTPEQIQAAKQLSASLNIPLRIRKFEAEKHN